MKNKMHMHRTIHGYFIRKCRGHIIGKNKNNWDYNKRKIFNLNRDKEIELFQLIEENDDHIVYIYSMGKGIHYFFEQGEVDVTFHGEDI